MISERHIVGELIRIGVPTLHEANHRTGFLTGLKLLVGHAFAGRAITVSLPAGDNLGVHLALADASAGSVLCVASRGGGLFGVTGELLQAAARVRGVAAMVIDDGIRDIVDLAAPPAIAARGITSRGTVKRRILAIDEPIGLAGVLVRPRDWVVGDANGVCVVSADSLDGVLVRARTRLDKEAGLLTQLRTGTTTVEALGLWQTRERRPG